MSSPAPRHSSGIARIGIVAKGGLRAASDHLEQLASWLRERDIEVVFETETAALAGAGNGAGARSREDRKSTRLNSSH